MKQHTSNMFKKFTTWAKSISNRKRKVAPTATPHEDKCTNYSELFQETLPRTEDYFDESILEHTFEDDSSSDSEAENSYSEYLREIVRELSQKKKLQTSQTKYAFSLHQREMFSPIECDLCFSKYNEGQILRSLPCTHEFHANCIDEWQKLKRKCPICRDNTTSYLRTLFL